MPYSIWKLWTEYQISPHSHKEKWKTKDFHYDVHLRYIAVYDHYKPSTILLLGTNSLLTRDQRILTTTTSPKSYLKLSLRF